MACFLVVVFSLVGCREEAPVKKVQPAPSPSSVASSSSEEISSSSEEDIPKDTLVADSVVAPAPESLSSSSLSSSSQSSSSVISSSSLESSSSEAPPSSSSQVVDTVVAAPAVAEPVVIDTVVADSTPVEPPKDTVVADTTPCADVPATVLCDKRDGKIYKTVHIGSQLWMAQNLNYASSDSWCYRNSLENCSNYGRLYQWTAAMNLDKGYSHSLAGNLIEEKHQGVCPDGWYMPKDSDMETLVRYVAESNKASGFAAEEVGTSLRKETGWEENDEEILGTNRYGFAAIPAGYRDANGSFAFLGEEADFWIADEAENGTHAPYWNLYYANQTFLGDYKHPKTFAYSVRCIKK